MSKPNLEGVLSRIQTTDLQIDFDIANRPQMLLTNINVSPTAGLRVVCDKFSNADSHA